MINEMFFFFIIIVTKSKSAQKRLINLNRTEAKNIK